MPDNIEQQDTLRWVDIARAAKMLGVVDDFSKRSMFDLNKKLRQSSCVEQVGRGRYRLVNDEGQP